MSATTMGSDVERYAEACEEHLRDLPPSVRAQLQLDIAEIVTEVCGELDGAPEDLVGPPLRFVTELRAAAGLTPPSAATPPSRDPTPGFGDRIRGLWSHPSVLWVRGLVPELVPAWWVARGALLSVAMAWVTGAEQRPEWLLFVPYWPVLGSRVVGLAVMGALVYLSVEAGRRALVGRRRLLRLAASLAAVGFALVLASTVRHEMAPSFDYSYGPPNAYDSTTVTTGLAVATPVGGVTIGSLATGESSTVIGLSSARSVVQDLLAQSSPAAIYVTHGDQRSMEMTAPAIDVLLQSLVTQGILASE